MFLLPVVNSRDGRPEAASLGPTLHLSGADGAPIMRTVSARALVNGTVMVTVEDRLNDSEGDPISVTARLSMTVRADACTPLLAEALLVVAGALTLGA